MVRAIVVGMGGRGQSWVKVCQASGLVDVVGIVEPVEALRTGAMERFKIPKEAAFNSLTEAIAAVEVDVVVDVTPPAAHEAVANEAFAAGLHVLGEKPLSDDFDAAKRIVDAAESAGVIHMVAQNYRFGPLPRTTRRVIDEGVIGKPELAKVDFYQVWAHKPGSHYVTMPYPLLTDMGIHHFDLMRYVFQREPLWVSAQSWNPSWGWHAGDAGHTLVVGFEGDLIVTHHALGSTVGRRTTYNGEWQIDGPEGSLTWENDHLWVTRTHPNDLARRDELPLDQVGGDTQTAVLAEFVRAVEQGEAPECNGRDNLRSLALTFCAVQSAREHRKVEIDELLS